TPRFSDRGEDRCMPRLLQFAYQAMPGPFSAVLVQGLVSYSGGPVTKGQRFWRWRDPVAGPELSLANTRSMELGTSLLPSVTSSSRVTCSGLRNKLRSRHPRRL